jgi:hypothetical protein
MMVAAVYVTDMAAWRISILLFALDSSSRADHDPAGQPN